MVPDAADSATTTSAVAATSSVAVTLTVPPSSAMLLPDASVVRVRVVGSGASLAKPLRATCSEPAVSAFQVPVGALFE